MSSVKHAGTLEHGVHQLIGRGLSAVEFVQDYIQLNFDGIRLTAYTLPSVEWGGRALRWGEPGYRDAICEQIGCLVVRTDVDAKRLLIMFEAGATLKVSLVDEDYRGPEALELVDGSNHWVA